jgi:hypothetical protein
MFKRARALDPHDADIHALLAETYLQMRKKAECEAAFTEALRLKPKNGIALGVKSDFEAIYYDVAKADQTAKIRLSKSPESTSAHLQSGRVCLAKGDVPQAYWHFREALRLSPNSEEARDALVMALVQRFPLYNWLHRIRLRLRRYRLLGSFGTYYVLFRLVAWASSDPNLPPGVRATAVGLAIAAGVAVAVVVLPMPFVSFALRFHPVGRYALTRLDKVESAFAALVVVTTVIAGLVGAASRSPLAMGLFAIGAIVLFMLALTALPGRRSSIRAPLVGLCMFGWIAGSGLVLTNGIAHTLR